MLTGDKRETAENIGFACNLLRDEMTRIYLLDGDIKELHKLCRQKLQAHKLQSNPKVPREDLALLVDGKALLELTRCMDEDAEVSPAAKEAMMDFLALATNCKAVICCRVSPDQKRQVVALVAKFVSPTPMTLSIGDGANDVPMILEASVRMDFSAIKNRVCMHTDTDTDKAQSERETHVSMPTPKRAHRQVGVGISGNEGMQAVRSADYAIAQFRFLKRLILVHGRANYKRVSLVVSYLYSFVCVCVCVCVCMYACMHGYMRDAHSDSLSHNTGCAVFTVQKLRAGQLHVLLRGLHGMDRHCSVRQFHDSGLQCPLRRVWHPRVSVCMLLLIHQR